MAKSGKYSVGVDLGGTNIKLGIVSAEGKIVKKTSVETLAGSGPESVISQIKKGINELLHKNKLKIKGIGIGSPGVVSVKKGTVENPPNFPGWTKVNLGRIIEKEFNIPVSVENDANAAAIGEMILGAGKKLNSFVMVTLGTGVGGGIIMDRKLFRGEFGAAGEVGHITIDYKGDQCNCGSYGCIETYAGNNYLIKRVKTDLENHPDSKIFELLNNNLTLLTPKIIDQAAEAGDMFALSVVTGLGNYLGAALASVSNLLDISTFIIGGGVAGFGTPLLNAINDSVAARVLTPLRPRVKIVPAKLKNDAGIQGASALVFYRP
ncbi:MAG: ROK family protein [Ignavibacteriaceae bacterium]